MSRYAVIMSMLSGYGCTARDIPAIYGGGLILLACYGLGMFGFGYIVRYILDWKAKPRWPGDDDE